VIPSSLPVGELAALAAAMIWSTTSIVFTSAGRTGSPVAVNAFKTLAGTLLFAAALLIRDGLSVGQHVATHDAILLVLSGLIGLSIGDSFLFRAFVTLGTRFAMLVFSMNPIIGAIAGYLFLGERLGPLAILGMAIALSGIALVIGERRKAAPDGLTPENGDGEGSCPKAARAARSLLLLGVLYSIGAAFGQAIGAVIIRSSLQRVDTLTATAIRMGSGAAGLLVLGACTGRLRRWTGLLARGGMLARLLAASVMGPFIGVYLMIVSLGRAPTGVALTLLSTTPIWLLPLGAWFQNDRPSKREIAGAFVAIGGVALLMFR
jgi:drug/metabolite transporter (DMT)-like permease